MNRIFLLIFGFSVLLMSELNAQNSQSAIPPYKNSELSTDERIDDIRLEAQFEIENGIHLSVSD